MTVLLISEANTQATANLGRLANVVLVMQVRVQSLAKGKSLPRIQSLPKEARTPEAQPGPIYRSCSDTKAEQDKWQGLATHESPKSAGRCIQIPSPASFHMPAEGHAPGSVPVYSSGKQAGRVMHETKPLARSVPDKASRLEGKAGEACHYVPSKAHTQGKMLKESSGKQAGRAVNTAKPQPGSIPEQATRPDSKADVTCNYVSASKSSSGKQAGRALQQATPQLKYAAKATRCEPERVAEAELACETGSDLAEAAHWEMLAPATYSFYSSEATAVAEDASLYDICTDHLCTHVPLSCLYNQNSLHFDSTPTCTMADAWMLPTVMFCH